MRAWRRFSLQGFRLRFVAVLFIGALCVGVALVAGHEGSSAPTAHILAGRDTRSQMAHARFARLTRARIGVSRGATTRRVETFLRTTQAVASTAATGSTPSEIGHRAGPRVPSERPLRVQRIGRSNRETLAVLRATKKARTRQHATTQKVSKSARRRSRSEYRRLTGREALPPPLRPACVVSVGSPRTQRLSHDKLQVGALSTVTRGRVRAPRGRRRLVVSFW
jgi:hypothetical protein